MGAVCGNCGVRSNDKSTCLTTGLTTREISLINMSWKQIAESEEVKSIALELFDGLFAAHPYMEKYFEAYELKWNPIHKNFRMSIHALMVVNRLDTFIEFIDKPTILLSLMEKLARSHFKKGITCYGIETFGDVFTDFLLKHLHKANSPKDIGDAWKKFFALLTRVFALVEGDACMVVTF